MDDEKRHGWIALHRKFLDSSAWLNHNVARFWIWCLLKATHTRYKEAVGYQEVILEPGQFIFGRKVASKETGLSEQTIRTCLAFLKTSGNLTIKPTNKFSLLTVVNWRAYQIDKKPPQPADQPTVNQQLTSNQPTSNQQVTTNKKGNKGEKGKNDKNGKNQEPTPTPDISAGGRRDQQAASLIKLYRETIARNPDNSYTQARKNAAKLLANGQAYETLSACVMNYGEAIAFAKTESQYRKAAGNFFGRDEVYKEYLPGVYVKPKPTHKTVYEILGEPEPEKEN